MDLELTHSLRGRKLTAWTQLLQQTGLTAQPDAQTTVLLWDDDTLAATGSRQGNLLKYIAVSPLHQGEDLTARVLTALRQDALAAGHSHLFLYTKPQNQYLFSSLFFYPVAQTQQAALMENRANGISAFLAQMPPRAQGEHIGAAVMNCNPFTLGHRYLIESAARECDHLYVFVLSEDQSRFRTKDRMEMVRLGTADLPNVTVLPTGPYLISSATFPDYFIQNKSRKTDIQCRLDLQIFADHFAPAFGITRRYVGEEPLSQVTNQYNQALKAHLPGLGISVVEIPRKCQADGVTPISASAVRSLLEKGELTQLRALVPETTYRYLSEL